MNLVSPPVIPHHPSGIPTLMRRVPPPSIERRRNVKTTNFYESKVEILDEKQVSGGDAFRIPRIKDDLSDVLPLG